MSTTLAALPKNKTSNRLSRGWRWVIGGFVVSALLLVAWVYRPLNATEQQLVGTWHQRVDEGQMISKGSLVEYYSEFRVNRRFEESFELPPNRVHCQLSSGLWIATRDEVFLWRNAPGSAGFWSQLKWRLQEVKAQKMQAFAPFRYRIQELTDTTLVLVKDGRILTFERQQ